MIFRTARLWFWIAIAFALGVLSVFLLKTRYELGIERAAKGVLELALEGQPYPTLETNLLRVGRRADDVRDDLKFEKHFPAEATVVFTIKGNLAMQVYQLSNVVQQVEIQKVEFK